MLLLLSESQTGGGLASVLDQCPIWFWVLFVTSYGACVGSFLNVVIYRIPAGKSIVSPPSACPKCGKGIRGYDNIPVISWLILGGKCRNCKNPISFQYPLVEAFTGLLFLSAYWVLYQTGWRVDWADAGIGMSWPAFAVYLVLLAALVATTMIDAKLYIIPLQIPWVATLVAFVVLPVGAIWLDGVVEVSPQVWGSGGLGTGIGGILGLLGAFGLMKLGAIPRSFDDEQELINAGQPTEQDKGSGDPGGSDESGEIAPEDDGPGWYEHPHVRREVLKECVFLLFPLIGMLLGGAIGKNINVAVESGFWQVLGGVLVGYLVGGGIVWGIRVLGTLAFGKEAMGLGDVPLLASIGAVMGATDSVLVFFLAPFFGLGYALLAFGGRHVLKRRFQQIPYGPHLALAAVLVMTIQPRLHSLFGVAQWLEILGIISK